MIEYLIRVVVTAVTVVVVVELAKRSSLAGAVLASIPLTSVMAMIWLYSDTKDVTQIAALARSIVWLVIPSIALFLLLPVLLDRGYGFYSSLGLSIAATVICYLAAVALAGRLGNAS